MGTPESEDREKYLDRTFPPPVSWESDAPGPFTDYACQYLSRPIRIDLVRIGKRYVLVDAIELYGNPLREEVRFRFRFETDPSGYEPPRCLGGLNTPVRGSTKALYYFDFSSDSTLDENVAEFRRFLAQHLEDELAPVVTEEPVSAPQMEVLPAPPAADTVSARLATPQELWPLVAMVVGVCGLVAMVVIVGLLLSGVVVTPTVATITLITAAFTASFVIGIGYERRRRSLQPVSDSAAKNGRSIGPDPSPNREEALPPKPSPDRDS